jgi:hypothetical protein
MHDDTRAMQQESQTARSTVRVWLRAVTATAAIVAVSGVSGVALASDTTGTQPRMSYVGLVGDVSCDEPLMAHGDAGVLVNIGLHAIVQAAPAELLVTSVRGNAETTVTPMVVTLASDVEGATPRTRDLEQQAKAVRIPPLVHALTVSPSDHCGTDIVSAIRVLRDTAAGGIAGRVGSPMAVIVDSNGIEVEQVHFESWYEAHPGADPAVLVKRMLAQGLGQDLHGVQIVWIGLGRIRRHRANVSYENSGVPNAEYRALQRFWNDYVTACGGAPIRFFPTIAVLQGGVAR